MEELINELKKENQDILHKNPKLAMEFDWSGDAYRLQYNEEMIGKLKLLLIPRVVLQSEQLPKNNCTLNRQTCGKGSGCKYPHCHI